MAIPGRSVPLELKSISRPSFFMYRFEGSYGFHAWGCSSVGRAPALQAGGHRFEPDHLHQLYMGR